MRAFEFFLHFSLSPSLSLGRQLSAFIVHMISEHPTAIEDIVNTFQSQQMPNVNQETQSWILMEILGAIPEEVGPLSQSGNNENPFQNAAKRYLCRISNWISSHPFSESFCTFLILPKKLNKILTVFFSLSL